MNADPAHRAETKAPHPPAGGCGDGQRTSWRRNCSPASRESRARESIRRHVRQTGSPPGWSARLRATPIRGGRAHRCALVGRIHARGHDAARLGNAPRLSASCLRQPSACRPSAGRPRQRRTTGGWRRNWPSGIARDGRRTGRECAGAVGLVTGRIGTSRDRASRGDDSRTRARVDTNPRFLQYFHAQISDIIAACSGDPCF